MKTTKQRLTTIKMLFKRLTYALVYQVFLYPIATLLFLILSKKFFYALYEINQLSITVFVIFFFVSYLIAYDTVTDVEDDDDTEGY